MSKYHFLRKFDFNKVLNKESMIIRVFPEYKESFSVVNTNCASCTKKHIGRTILIEMIQRTDLNKDQLRVVKQIIPLDIYKMVENENRDKI